MEDVLTHKGKLLCVPCVKSIGANRKAVLLHQSSRKHILNLEKFSRDDEAGQLQKRTYLMNIPINSLREGCLLPAKSSSDTKKAKKSQSNKESSTLMDEQEGERGVMRSSSAGASSAGVANTIILYI